MNKNPPSRPNSHDNRQHPGLVTVAICGLIGYLVLFYACPLPSLGTWGEDGQAIRRGSFLSVAVLTFDQFAGDWFGTPAELSLADRLPILATATSILVIAVLLGRLLLAAVRADRGLGRTECLVFATAVGMNGIALYVLVAGLAGGLHSRTLFVLPALGILGVSAVHWWQTDGDRTALALSRETEANDNWISNRWLWLAAPFVAVTLLGGTLPPIEFDVREYHLQAPKEFYQLGRIAFLPHNVYANMPLGAEMPALLGMVLMGDWFSGALVGKLLIAMHLPVTAVALWAAGNRLFSRSAGIVAAILYVSTLWMLRVSNLGLVEGALALNLWLAVFAVMLWNRGVRPDDDLAGEEGEGGSAERENGLTMKSAMSPEGLLAVAGFLAGAAAACKYTGLVFAVVPLGLWVAFAARSGRARALGIFLLAAVLGCGPWLAKNAVLAGNPTYPLLSRVFAGTSHGEDLDRRWRAAHRPGEYSVTAAARGVASVGLQSEWLHPLTMPLALLALAVHRHRRRVLFLGSYFLFVVACWWLLTHRIDRFWIPALPALMLLAGCGAVWTSSRPWRYVVTATLAVTLAANFVFATCGPGGYNRYFQSYDRLRTSAERVDPWHRYLNDHVAQDDAVLVVGDAQVFDLAVPCFYNTVFDRCRFEQMLRGRTAAEFHARLTELRISHVFVHWGEIARYRSPGNYGFTDFVQPEVFARLVEQRVLAPPEPPIDGHPGEVYPVLAVSDRE